MHSVLEKIRILVDTNTVDDTIHYIQSKMEQLNWNERIHPSNDIHSSFLTNSSYLLVQLSELDFEWSKENSDLSPIVQPHSSSNVEKLLVLLTYGGISKLCKIRLHEKSVDEKFGQFYKIIPQTSDISISIAIVQHLTYSALISHNVLELMLKVGFYNLLSVLLQMEHELKQTDFQLAIRHDHPPIPTLSTTTTHPSSPSNKSFFEKIIHIKKNIFPIGNISLSDWARIVIDSLTHWIPLNSLFVNTYAILVISKTLKYDWAITRCSKLLTSIVTDPSKKGVFSVLNFFLETSDCVDDKLIQHVSNTIASVPRELDFERYLGIIAPQLIGILKMKDHHLNQTENYKKAVAQVISLLSTKNRGLTVKYVIQPICDVILSFVQIFKYNFKNSQLKKFHRLLNENILQLPKKKIQNFDSEKGDGGGSGDSAAVDLGEFLDYWPVVELNDDSDDIMGVRWRRRQSYVDVTGNDGDEKSEIFRGFDMERIESFVRNISIVTSALRTRLDFGMFVAIIPGLFDLWVALVVSIKSSKKRCVKEANLRDEVQFLLDLLLHKLPQSIVLEIFKYLLLENDKNWNKVSAFQYKFHMTPSSTGGKFELLATEIEPTMPSRDILCEMEHLVLLLKYMDRERRNDDCETSDMAGNLFIFLLDNLLYFSDLYNYIRNESVLPSPETPQDTTEIRISEEGPFPSSIVEYLIANGYDMEKLIEYYQMALRWIVNFSENLGPRILRNGVQIYLFLKRTIQMNEENVELMTVTLNVLEHLVCSRFLKNEESDILHSDILGCISKLLEHRDKSVRLLARSVWDQLIESQSTIPHREKETSATVHNKTRTNQSTRRWVQKPLRSDLDEVLNDIRNPQPAIRAGGMIQLRRMILYENDDVLARMDEWIEIFMKNLKDDDSYVYQGAIWGLASIGDVDVGRILPILKNEFENPQIPINIRLNIGEVFLQIARRLGEALKKYVGLFLNIFLARLKADPDPYMRASSLSNVAEVCQLVKFALLPFITEIIATAKSALLCEKDHLVRQGLVHLFRLLFVGLGNDLLTFIPQKEVFDIKEILEAIEHMDEDQATRVHANYALLELNVSLEKFVQTQTKATTTNELLEPHQETYQSFRLIQ